MEHSNRAFAQALIRSAETDGTSYLYGPIEPHAYHSLDRLTKHLGLGTTKTLTEWMRSPDFALFYNDLYESTIRPRAESSPGSRGP
jgi:hypothetical protein